MSKTPITRSFRPVPPGIAPNTKEYKEAVVASNLGAISDLLDASVAFISSELRDCGVPESAIPRVAERIKRGVLAEWTDWLLEEWNERLIMGYGDVRFPMRMGELKKVVEVPAFGAVRTEEGWPEIAE